MPNAAKSEKTDVVLIGAGIMSATLGALLRQLQPDWTISVFERLDAAAAESSDPWNNAGTGHSALCELNYSPQNADGSVDVSKAVDINERFQVSRQFWAYAVDTGVLDDPAGFINPIPHVSFVHGADNVEYLRKRHEALSPHPLFRGMEFIDDPGRVRRAPAADGQGPRFQRPDRAELDPTAAPISTSARSPSNCSPTSATPAARSPSARGPQPRQAVRRFLERHRPQPAHRPAAHHQRQVRLRRRRRWRAALLQKAGIKEAKGFGGFPISGQFLAAPTPS